MHQDQYDHALETLLAEDEAAAAKRARTEFDRQAGSLRDSLVLFGAGGIGKKMVAGLRKIGIEPLAFADNNSALWDTRISAVPVYSPRVAAEKFGKTAVFVVTIWRGEGSDRMHDHVWEMRELGCACVLPFGFLFWKYAEVFTPHYSFDLPEHVLQQKEDVRKASSLFCDEASRREFLAQLRWRLLLDFDGLPPPVAHTIYFPDDLIVLQPDEVFVDAGAFDGDTIQSLVAKQGAAFAGVIAFEPDPANFARLTTYVASLPIDVRRKIELHPVGLGTHRHSVFFEASGTSAATESAQGVEVEIASLDEMIGNRPCSYLKLDIEGAEVNALRGARHCIERNRPVLAVCSYHKQDHLWRIPLLIHSYASKYRFFLRPHLLEVWDLVCYAVPEERLVG
jgi:FkbM family methyltransferase